MAQILKGGSVMSMIGLGTDCLLLSALFRAVAWLYLTLPLLYALLVPTLFSGRYYSHYIRADTI